jgi:hypothetical protein
VLTAALDAARLGARAPLSPDLLRAAAPGYCTPRQQAEAPDNWFEQALAYATAWLHGAVAALSPTGVDMGRVVGYTVADYLIQHASQQRGSARVPASTWDAILSHIRDPADATRLAHSARNRLLYRYAIQLYRHAIQLYRHATDAGDGDAARSLAELLAQGGDLDDAEQILRARADAGDEAAAQRLNYLLAERGDLDGLRARADADDWDAAGRLAQLVAWDAAGRLAKRSNLEGLRAWAAVAYEIVASRPGPLAQLLAQGGDLDRAEQILRARADAGDQDAARELAKLLRERGDLDGLQARADAGNEAAAGPLAGLLAERGDLDRAEQILRARADAGDEAAAGPLADLLTKQGRGEEAERLRRFGLNLDGSIACA